MKTRRPSCRSSPRRRNRGHSSLLQTSRPNLRTTRAERPLQRDDAPPVPAALLSQRGARQIVVEMVSGKLLEVLGVSRRWCGLLPRQYSGPRQKPGAVLSHGFWQRRLGGDRSVVGRTLTQRPASRWGGSAVRLQGRERDASPLCGGAHDAPEVAAGSCRRTRLRGALVFDAIGLLSRRRAGAGLEPETIADQLAREYPDDTAAQVALMPLGSHPHPGFRQNIVRWVAPDDVVALVCHRLPNVANLLLARAAVRPSRGRRASVAGRLARGRIRQLLTEGLLLAIWPAPWACSCYWARASCGPASARLPADSIDPDAGRSRATSPRRLFADGDRLRPRRRSAPPSRPVAELKQRGRARVAPPLSLRNVLVRFMSRCRWSRGRRGRL